MADFRRWILALAVLVLVLGSVAPASAQTQSFSCTSSAAVTPTLRHEGLDELAGDILITCTGGTPTASGAPVPQGNFQVNLSLPFTSRLLSGNISEALLLVDDPAPANQTVCNSPNNPTVACLDYGGTPPGSTYNTTGRYNVFQGINSSVPGQQDLVTFLGVPIDAPATPGSFRTYRITNLRVNASGAALLQTVFGFVSVSSSTSVPINPPQQAVGVVENGLTVTAKSTNPNFLQCESYGTTAVGSVNFTENFATAFKILTNGVQNVPGTVYNSESGLEIVTAVGTTGTATTGTQLAATISNIPSGVTVYVDNWAQSTAAVCTGLEVGASCTLPSDATLVTSKSTEPPADPSANTITAVTDGTESSVTVYWEVVHTNSSAIDSLTFNIYASFTGMPGSPGSPSPTGVETTAVGSYWPLVASWANGPVPEFSTTVNIATTPTNLFQVALCETILLFPYVTDYTGFDTGIAISNTSSDPLGTGIGALNQAGPCTVTFYGVGSPTLTGTPYSSTSDSSLTNGVIPTGTTWAFSLSTIDTEYASTATYGLVGYAIAVCNFQYAHGYSFVSDYGLRNWAAAYLALVIPDAPRSPQPFNCSENGGSCSGQTGEQLVH